MKRTTAESRDGARRRRLLVAIVLVAVAVLGGRAVDPRAEAGKIAPPSVVRVRVTHRVHAQFQDTLSVAMHERRTVGDSDFDFELVDFYPQFAIVDSTHAIISLSDEPKNPAFRVRIYKDGEPTEETWAFYGVEIPHFARTSYLAFQVLGFEYRGKIIGDVPRGKKPSKGAKP